VPGLRTSYPIPKAAASAEQTVRASRFICHVGPASSLKEVTAELDRLASIHPKANHICWACIIGPPGSPERAMSDDGEPRGTAGRPMLTVLDHSGYGEIWAAVVRYFGGIKLGKGGLIRAYTSSLQQALARLESIEKQPLLQFRLCLDYNLLPLCERLLAESGGSVIKRSFSDTVVLELQLPESSSEAFVRKMITVSGGKARCEVHE